MSTRVNPASQIERVQKLAAVSPSVLFAVVDESVTETASD